MLITVAVVFIGSSAAQIIPAVFRLRSPPRGAGGGATPDEQACLRGVAQLTRALDRATGQTWTDGDAFVRDGQADRALTAFWRGLAPEWDATGDVERACAQSASGKETWAAVLRLRRAHEQVLLRDRLELLPLRRDVPSHVAEDLR